MKRWSKLLKYFFKMINLMKFGLSKPTNQSLVVKLKKDIQKNGTNVMKKIWETFQGFFFENWGN